MVPWNVVAAEKEWGQNGAEIVLPGHRSRGRKATWREVYSGCCEGAPLLIQLSYQEDKYKYHANIFNNGMILVMRYKYKWLRLLAKSGEGGASSKHED